MNRSLIWKGVGILFAVVGLYFMMQSIQFYVECCRQVDWPMETATVVAVEQRWERSGIRSGRKMVYDVDYRYTVDGTVYAPSRWAPPFWSSTTPPRRSIPTMSCRPACQTSSSGWRVLYSLSCLLWS